MMPEEKHVSKAKPQHGGSSRANGKLPKLYYTWMRIRQRCLDIDYPNYSLYGGRGITISPEWAASYEAFARDMGQPPDKCFSIERLDNNGGYHKGNCVWATKKDQGRNRRTNKLSYKDVADILAMKGKVKVVYIALEYNIARQTVYKIFNKERWA